MTVLGNPALGGQGATVSGTKSNGTMEYNSLQAVLQKQMSHGLQDQVSYTYSKCMSDSTGYYGAWNNALSASAYWQNVYDQRSEWAPCYYDATHVLSAYAIYDLPFGHGKQFAGNANKVVNESHWRMGDQSHCHLAHRLATAQFTEPRIILEPSVVVLEPTAMPSRRSQTLQSREWGFSGSPTTETSPNRRWALSETARHNSEVCVLRTSPTWT